MVLIRTLGVVCPSTQDVAVAGVYSLVVVVVGAVAVGGEVVASWIWNYAVAGNRMKSTTTNG